MLKTKYDSAKAYGATVNDSKGRINELRAAIEQRRLQRAAAAMSGGPPPDEDDPQEAPLKEAMDKASVVDRLCAGVCVFGERGPSCAWGGGRGGEGACDKKHFMSCVR